MTHQGIAGVTTTNLDAYSHYFLGEQFMNQMKTSGAQEEYKKAIALDSTFALAYYGLAYAISFVIGNESAAREPLDKELL